MGVAAAPLRPHRSHPGHPIAFAVHSRWLVLSSLVYGLALRAELFLATVFLTAEAFATYAAPARMFAIVEFTMATMGAVLLPNAARLSSSADLRGYVRRGVSVTLGFALVGGVVALERAPIANTLLGSITMPPDWYPCSASQPW